ncbi:MAG: serine hydrolase [Pirellula sp.]
MDEIRSLIDAHAGDVAVSIKHLGNGLSFEHRGSEVQATASLIKFPILVELYKQSEANKVSLDKMITLREEDKVPGSGILTSHFPAGSQIPLQGIAQLMIAFSDNTATNLVIEQVGLQSVAATMDELGLKETRANSKVFRRDTSVAPERSEKYGLGSTTANEMIKLLELLQARKLVSPSASEQMLKHLAACDDATKLRRHLPKTVKTFNKTGAVANTRTDAGIFEMPDGPVAIVVLTTKNRDATWGNENAAEILCGKIGEIVHKQFSRSISNLPKSDSLLTVGASGEMVEALQRALNNKVKMDVALTVDGDFGSMTATALRKFQSENGLEVTGSADEKTWKKLGPLQLQEEQSPAPELVNSEKLPLAPLDPLDGFPFVSCAWLVADANTGKVIGGDKINEKLDIASTTKIMTAWIVCRECDRNPSVLDELLTFSKRADDTVGSSATVRVGERLPIREALYGLMLPSGNDMSVALAEHFGARLSDSNSAIQDPLEQFVASMNREAKRLGMDNTQYLNPHGLTVKNHQSSCSDLLTLTRTALDSKLLRDVVKTRQHGYTLHGAAGYSRNVVWKNTNLLLATEGYFGMKTGTTDAAGACLVSCSERDGQSIVVIVLGASGSAARYSDSRNLHRWGWQTLKKQ